GIEPVRFQSPITRTGAARRGVSAGRTLAFNAARLGGFRRSVHLLRDASRRLRPDLVVNFYDSVGGQAFGHGGGDPPLVCLGHHYLLGHPDAPTYPGGRILGAPFPLMNRLSAPTGVPRIALSLRRLP